MTYRPRWDNGGWNVICDQCGRQFKDSELQLRWDGFMVCSRDWEPRQPQDFVHGVADIQAPKWARPEQTDHFIWQELDQSESIALAETFSTKLISPAAINGAAINSLGLNK
jgi:hypothetical protein